MSRIDWEKLGRRVRLWESARQSRDISKELFTKVWQEADTAETAAEILGIEPKDVFWLRKSYGLPFKPGGSTREARGRRGL